LAAYTLRWAVRSDGNSGYVFVNNYQRLQPMPAKAGVQFQLNLPSGNLIFPAQPVTIPADGFFFWPFNLDLGGTKLIYATAQPVCRTIDGRTQTFYFAETPGVPAEFVFDSKTLAGQASSWAKTIHAKTVVKTGREPAFTLQTPTGVKIQIVVLSEADSLALQKTATGHVMFESEPQISTTPVKTESVQSAGPAREIPLGGKSHLALAPVDADFTNAAVWKITLPAKIDLKRNPLLRIHYVGDVARLTLNGKLLDDNFYSGREFDLGLNRYAPEILHGDLRLEILPLRKDAPIYLEPSARPDFGTNENIVKLQSAEIINR
jgi:beta-galactosidase